MMYANIVGNLVLNLNLFEISNINNYTVIKKEKKEKLKIYELEKNKLRKVF